MLVIFNHSSLGTENQLSNQWEDWHYFSKSQSNYQNILWIGSFFALLWNVFLYKSASLGCTTSLCKHSQSQIFRGEPLVLRIQHWYRTFSSVYPPGGGGKDSFKPAVICALHKSCALERLFIRARYCWAILLKLFYLGAIQPAHSHTTCNVNQSLVSGNHCDLLQRQALNPNENVSIGIGHLKEEWSATKGDNKSCRGISVRIRSATERDVAANFCPGNA